MGGIIKKDKEGRYQEWLQDAKRVALEEKITSLRKKAISVGEAKGKSGVWENFTYHSEVLQMLTIEKELHEMIDKYLEIPEEKEENEPRRIKLRR